LTRFIIEGHSDGVNSIVYDGNLLFSGSFDGTVKIWTTARGVELKTIKRFDDSSTSVLTTPTGLFAIFAQLFIGFKLESRTVTNIEVLPNSIMGGIFYKGNVVLELKNFTHLTTASVALGQTSESFSFDYAEITTPCNSFYAFDDSFLFGHLDGSISTLSLDERVFSKTV
jgi:WD40 repeat protein